MHTLVLNADMTPISIFPLHMIRAQDAVVRCLNGTAFAVAEYDRRILTQHTVMHWPAVIARKEYVRLNRYCPISRANLFYRDGGQCAYCLKYLTISSTTMDHVIPKSHGGKYKWDNIVASCARCNHSKSSQLPTGYWKPQHKAWTPTYYSLLKCRRKFSITIGHESWLDYLGDWEGEVTVIGTSAIGVAHRLESG